MGRYRDPVAFQRVKDAAINGNRAFAQDMRVYGPGYYGQTYEGPAYRHRVFRGAYNEGPAIGPLFYGDGWVPESIYDHSRTGGIDPNIRPSN